MQPLSTVSCSYLTPGIINKLLEAGITSVSEFFNQDINYISSETQIPYKDLNEIRQELVKQFAPLLLKASDLYYEHFKQASIFSTGCVKLDSLCEGIFTGEITEIVGSSSSGKTQLCFSLATSVCLETRRSVLYVDTNNSFSAHRIYELACVKATDEHALRGMKRIQSLFINNVHDLIAYLSDPQNFSSDLGLITIDSIFSLLSPHLDVRQYDGRGHMVQVAQLLSSIASTRHLAVVLCNCLVQGDNYTLKPGLGRYWQHVPSVRIQIEPENLRLSAPGGTGVGNQRRVTLIKSSRQATGKNVLVQLNANGFL